MAMMTDGNEMVSGRDDSFLAQASRLVQATRDAVNAKVEPIAEPLMRDGMLAGAWRQGADELFQALKAFPDGIEGHAQGTLNNPLQSEIADARQAEQENENGRGR
jgi:hypothetical protein